MEIASSSTTFRKLDLTHIKVTLFLQSMRVDGTIHVEKRAQRFSDSWDALIRDRRRYIPLTDATITTPDGRSVTSPFMVVDKEEIRAACPADG